MFLLIFGLIIFVIGLLAARTNTPFYPFRNWLKIAGSAIILLGLFTSTVVQIDAAQVGVQSLFGKVQPRILESGLNIVNPLVEVSEFDIKTQNYTMSRVHDEGDKTGDDAIRVLSADGLEVVIDLTVLYRVLPIAAPELYSRIGLDYQNTIVRPVLRTKIRDNAVYYDAVSLYSSKRDEFQALIFNSIEKDFKRRGLVLEQLLIRNIDLPASVKATIESKINAEQEALKMQFVLQKEKQEAERRRIEAQGISDYQRIVNQELSEKLLQYESIKANKEIALSPNTKVIIMGNNRGNTPILLTDK